MVASRAATSCRPTWRRPRRRHRLEAGSPPPTPAKPVALGCRCHCIPHASQCCRHPEEPGCVRTCASPTRMRLATAAVSCVPCIASAPSEGAHTRTHTHTGGKRACRQQAPRQGHSAAHSACTSAPAPSAAQHTRAPRRPECAPASERRSAQMPRPAPAHDAHTHAHVREARRSRPARHRVAPRRQPPGQGPLCAWL